MMGSTCSNQRSSGDDQSNRFRFGRFGTSGSQRADQGETYGNSLRHAVIKATPDRCLASLYPVTDNFVVEPDGTKTPKPLADLAMDSFCRSLVHLEGSLPHGLPPDVVSDLAQSLYLHGAWNATSLAMFAQCELEHLNLGRSRGVTDFWLKVLMQNSEPRQPESIVEYSRLLVQDQEPSSQQFMDVESSTSDDDSSTSFASAADNFMDVAPPQDVSALGEDTIMLTGEDSKLESLPTTTPSHRLAFLDLSRSQHITDQGLLLLTSNLECLEEARFDHCHSLKGPGLAVLTSSHCLKSLSLAHCRRMTDDGLSHILHCYRLEYLSLAGCRCITDRSMAALADLVSLRTLHLSQCDLITDDGLDQLEGLEQLQEVSLAWCPLITDQGLDAFTFHPGRSINLRRLRLSRCPLEEVSYLGRLSALEELDISGCTDIGSSALGKTLKYLKKLEALDVSYCEGILRSGWQGKIDNLKVLNACYAAVRESHLGKLTNLPALEELNLDSCHVGDWSMSHLAGNDVTPNLARLNLADTNLTDAGMVHIGKFKKLTHLSLFYCNISNQSLRHISNLVELQVLNLDSRDISDEGLGHLENLKSLKALDIFSGRITSSGCSQIAKIQTLESLCLCGGGVDDLGCIALAKLPNLRDLNLSQNESITNHGAAALGNSRELRHLNLSNTDVNSGVLRYFSGFAKLESLTLYGCRGMDYRTRIDWFKSRLPSLQCLRLDNTADTEGKMSPRSEGTSSENGSEGVWGMSDDELE